MKLVAAAVTVLAGVGFCINAALSRCEREHGSFEDAREDAARAVVFLVLAILFGVIAWTL